MAKEKHEVVRQQPGTNRPSQFPNREKPKAVTLRNRRREAKKIQRQRLRTWAEDAYGPRPDNDI